MIERSELAMLAKSFGAKMREYVGAAIVGLVSREQLEERLKQIPAGPEGKQGPQGERGEMGVSVVGAIGEKGETGERGEKGDKGDTGPQGERGERGEKGEPGLSIKGDPGIDGKDGRDGRDAVAKDGRDGANGKDALELQILHSIPETVPPLGTWARHKGGLWRYSALGWEVIVDGISGFEIMLSDDMRTFSFEVEASSGVRTVKSFRLPVMLYRDIFKEGSEYFQGDVVVADNSSWHCQVESTKTRPGVSKDWRLIARKGADGKDGKNGERGPQGLEGRPGRDSVVEWK